MSISRIKVGAKPNYKTPEDLINKINEYFEWIEGEYEERKRTKSDGSTEYYYFYIREPEEATINGLTLFLGFKHRQSLTDYKNKNEEFSDIIKTARTIVEYCYEKQLTKSKNPTGAIFALKNMSWSDKVEIKQKNKGTIEIVRKTIR